MHIISLYFTIRPAKISWLRFILEGYDNLALLSTISAQTGLVRVQAPEDNAIELLELMAAVTPELSPFPLAGDACSFESSLENR